MQFLRFTALAASVLTGWTVLSAVPAFAEGEQPAETVLSPIYEPDQPYAADLHLSVNGTLPSTLRIYQHSPEAESLLICDAQLPAQTADYVLSLEPGEYTCAVSASALSDGFAPMTAEQAFTVENPDFSEKLSYTDYNLSVSFEQIGSDALPEKTVTDLKKTLKNQRRTLTQQISFQYYGNRIAGDYDGDGAVTAFDASLVLTEFTRKMVGLESDPPCTNEQLYACDVDGSGKLESSDASSILLYFTLKTAGIYPDWDMVL